MSATNSASETVVAAMQRATAVLKTPHEAFLSSTISEALPHFRHLFPELVSYRGGLFNEAHFDKGMVDDFFDMAAFGDGGSAIPEAEASVNSVGLFAHEVEAGDREAADAVIAAIGWIWERWVRETYDVEIEVLSSIDAEDGAYITFRSRPA
ncbi:hypothetical protein [Brevundimonas sp.]|uniref:hypothetical protein n=1 Tax=Brevundimonas sp. TaxID=1871086 RepID=UPI003A93F058